MAGDAPPTREYSAHQRGALLVLWLLTEGPQRAETLRPRLYDTDTNSTYNLLNNVAGVLPLANRDGWWHLDLDYILSDLKVFDAAITERLDETYDGVAYTRGFKRRDMIRLQQIVRHLRKIGQSPP